MSKKINENYIHNCDFEKISVCAHAKSIVEMNFSQEEVKKILNFYLFHAPILKSEKQNDTVGLKSLKDFGWEGNSKLSSLEGKLLSASGITTFCIIKSDSIKETLKAMDLDSKICIEHPRAVIKQNCKAKILEDGSVRIDSSETRMFCLFRHIRNSFAHNQTYEFENGNILLEDHDENNNITARILIHRNTLIDWIAIVEQNIQPLK